ncbi:MAG TPA: hypothetical protein DIT47_03905 [Flavobacteriaceae bacterium]|nr:hypothetical protein [Flavobacteriaceae bacterium]
MWYNFDNSNSIGKIGSEEGIILSDFENINGARITLEKGGRISPYSVTLGIYGLLFHTYFCSSESEAIKFREKSIKRIDEIFKLLDVNENERNNDWEELYNSKLNEICEN